MFRQYFKILMGMRSWSNSIYTTCYLGTIQTIFKESVRNVQVNEQEFQWNSKSKSFVSCTYEYSCFVEFLGCIQSFLAVSSRCTYCIQLSLCIWTPFLLNCILFYVIAWTFSTCFLNVMEGSCPTFANSHCLSCIILLCTTSLRSNQ